VEAILSGGDEAWVDVDAGMQPTAADDDEDDDERDE